MLTSRTNALATDPRIKGIVAPLYFAIFHYFVFNLPFFSVMHFVFEAAGETPQPDSKKNNQNDESQQDHFPKRWVEGKIDGEHIIGFWVYFPSK